VEPDLTYTGTIFQSPLPDGPLNAGFQDRCPVVGGDWGGGEKDARECTLTLSESDRDRPSSRVTANAASDDSVSTEVIRLGQENPF
jgi:hypothetical protein